MMINTNDPRFPRAMAQTAMGRLFRNRFFCCHDGSKDVEFFVVDRKRKNPPIVGIIGEDERAYTKAIREYGEQGDQGWRSCWWREAIQNAVDAGATEVHLDATKNADGLWVISCQDNGKGMSGEVILNKFLTFGGTTKGAGQSGGFGIAKELLILPWLNWEVHSGTVKLGGYRKEYKGTDEAEYLQGTRLAVLMPESDHTDIGFAANYISKCSLPHIRFIVNGVVINADLILGDAVDPKVIEDSDIQVFVNRRSSFNKIFIYDNNNLLMFEKPLPETVHGHVICKITGDTKRILTSNRLGWSNTWTEDTFGKFLHKLSTDVASALLPPPDKRSQKIFRSRIGAGRADPAQAEAHLQELFQKHFTIDKAPPSRELMLQALQTLANDIEEDRVPAEVTELIINLLGAKTSDENQVNSACKQLANVPNFALVNELKDFDIPKNVTPGKMPVRLLKLIRFWTECCRIILIRLGETRSWNVGWVFSRDVVARFSSCMEGEDDLRNFLLLNPYKKVISEGIFGKEFYSMTEEEDRNYVFATAVHECVHFACNQRWHDEDFTAYENSVWAKVIPSVGLRNRIYQAIARRGEKE